MTSDAPIKDMKNLCKVKEVNDISLYEIISNDDEVLYIGAGPLRSMLSEHLPDGVFPLQGARYYRTFTVSHGKNIEDRRISLIQDHLDICGKKPRYNSNE